MNISKRLLMVASLVSKGNVVADIGTDHGYVPIYLVENGICPSAYAADINEGPLERAKEHIEQKGLSKQITLVKSDGMKGLEGKAIDSVIIAGMGGELICRIICESNLLENVKEMILSPHGDVDMVRKTAFEKGFSITDEKMIEEYGKYYNIIKCEKMTQDLAYTDFELKYGRILFDTKDKVFLEYLKKQEIKYLRIIANISEHNSKDDKRLEEMENLLKECRKAIDIMER